MDIVDIAIARSFTKRYVDEHGGGGSGSGITEDRAREIAAEGDAKIVGTACEEFDTLGEIADELNTQKSTVDDIKNSVNNKVEAVIEGENIAFI